MDLGKSLNCPLNVIMDIKILYNEPKIELCDSAKTIGEFLNNTKCEPIPIRVCYGDVAMDTVLSGSTYLRLVREDNLFTRDTLYYVLHYLTAKLWVAKAPVEKAVRDIEFDHVCTISYGLMTGSISAILDGTKIVLGKKPKIDPDYIDYNYIGLRDYCVEAIAMLKDSDALCHCPIARERDANKDDNVQNYTYLTLNNNAYQFTTHKAEVVTSADDIYRAAKIAELAGRCSHKSPCDPDKAPWEFLSKLVDMGHVSVLRHINITCKFSTDRTASHQLVRHSHISWTQESQRYVKYNGDKNPFLFVLSVGQEEPDRLEVAPSARRSAIETCVDSYMSLTATGTKAEEARKLLPGCMHTVLYGTGNAEAWGHFFKMRCDKHAQADIRHMALSLLERFNTLMPGLYKDLSKF